jgi:3-methyladenine DNA glycosylase/8-oxoguanine DNA glycosylase
MFDLDLDPAALAVHFAGDGLLAPRLAALPGIRLPRAWEPFELAVRAVLGQQVSVRAATTLAARIASSHGIPCDAAPSVTDGLLDGQRPARWQPEASAPPSGPAAGGETLTRLFPGPAQLVEAPLESLGVMPARARTIRALSLAVLDGQVSLAAGGDGHLAADRLRAIGGIGPWTASYIAMRGFGEADAFPSGDLILQRAAGGLTARTLEARSQAWRPWRAYAVMLLWQAPVQ